MGYFMNAFVADGLEERRKTSCDFGDERILGILVEMISIGKVMNAEYGEIKPEREMFERIQKVVIKLKSS